MTAPVLSGSRVKLRPPVEADIGARHALGNDPDIHRMYGGSQSDFRPFTPERAAEWYRTLIALPHAWVIEVDGRLIGDIRLHAINEVDRRGTLAIGIADREALGRGYGTEATTLLLTHSFTTLGLHRISLRVLAYNERAIASYLKCGFAIEGRERESAQVDGEWHDDIMMGILAQDHLAEAQ